MGKKEERLEEGADTKELTGRQDELGQGEVQLLRSASVKLLEHITDLTDELNALRDASPEYLSGDRGFNIADWAFPSEERADELNKLWAEVAATRYEVSEALAELVDGAAVLSDMMLDIRDDVRELRECLKGEDK